MDFKKLFRKDEKAVSPVIGVILMVAITVILAAAIGSSVFSKGTAEAAPQANLNMKANALKGITIEHLGGDTINFGNTKIMMYDGAADVGFAAPADTTTLSTGGIMMIDFNTTLTTSKVINIKMIDKTTNQLICDKNVRFTA